jgi:hypothetical protein
VRFYYFSISDKDEEGYFKSTLVNQKIEINNRAFDVKDIFGMEKFLQGNGDDDDKLCVICCANISNILIIPCLHLNICADCIQAIKKSSPEDKDCPVCRTSKISLILLIKRNANAHKTEWIRIKGK